MRYHQIELFGHPFLTDPDDSLDLAKWGEYEVFESSLIRDAVKGKVCIDVGAHIGYYTVLMASAGAKEIVAFEANPLNYALLQLNVKPYYTDPEMWSNIRTWNYAVTERGVHHVTIHLSPTNSGDDTIYPFDDLKRFPIEVATTCIAYYYPDFIKMDIQGGEIRALRGMREPDHPMTMAIEFFPDALRAAGDDPKEMLAILRGWNFNLWEIREDSKSLVPITSPAFADRADLEHGYTNIWAVRE